jgi:NAD(P)H dehydrogenase (quinone)
VFTITGITGKVGGALARKLLEAGQPVRAVVRDAAKGHAWADKGCKVAIAEMEDAEALAQALPGPRPSPSCRPRNSTPNRATLKRRR